MRAPCREDFQQSLQRRNSLTLHGWVIGLFMMSFMWAMSRFQWMFLGDGSLALRYLVTLSVGYLGYLLVLRAWAARLVRQRDVLTGKRAALTIARAKLTAGRDKLLAARLSRE